MIIGDHLRAIREEKKFSQGEIEKRTGLLRCYISRVENGHTVPAVETLEKFARALEVPLYQLFYDSDKPPALPNILKRTTGNCCFSWPRKWRGENPHLTHPQSKFSESKPVFRLLRARRRILAVEQRYCHACGQ